MSTPGLFVVGVLVTLIVAVALALLIYAAILDGRYATAQSLGDEHSVRSDADPGPAIAA